jgi:hypothetical protein
MAKDTIIALEWKDPKTISEFMASSYPDQTRKVISGMQDFTPCHLHLEKLRQLLSPLEQMSFGLIQETQGAARVNEKR